MRDELSWLISRFDIIFPYYSSIYCLPAYPTRPFLLALYPVNVVPLMHIMATHCLLMVCWSYRSR